MKINIMAHIQHLDDLVREYLLFKGFTITLKSFDAELKVDKDRGFRVCNNILWLCMQYTVISNNRVTFYRLTGSLINLSFL